MSDEFFLTCLAPRLLVLFPGITQKALATFTYAFALAAQILENEVKILRNESRTKDEGLSKMMIKTAQAINVRDQVGKLQSMRRVVHLPSGFQRARIAFV